MKSLIILSFFLISFASFAQEKTNQLTEKNQKTGLWISYFENGKIKDLCFYEPFQRIHKERPEEAFLQGRCPKDSLIISAKLIWSEQYEYNLDWTLKRIKRTDSTHSITLLYGPQKIVRFSDSEYVFTERVGNQIVFKIELKNQSNTSIELYPICHYKVMSDEKIILKPNSTSVFNFKMRIEENDHNFSFFLKNDSTLIEYEIVTFGYHYKTEDFQSNDTFQVSKNFIYYRTGSEALMTILDKNKKKEIKSFSLAKVKTNIELEGIKKGFYWLKIIDYSKNKTKLVGIKIE